MQGVVSGLLPFFELIAAILYFETMLRLATIKEIPRDSILSVTLWSMFYAALTALAVEAARLALPFSPNVWAAIWTLVLILLFFIFASQLVYYSIFKMLYTLYSMGNAGQVLDFVKDILAYIAAVLHWLLALSIPLVAHHFFFAGLTPVVTPAVAPAGLTPLVTVAILTCLALVLYGIARVRPRMASAVQNAACEAYHRSMDPTVTLRHFGLLTTMRLDFQRTVLKRKSQIYDDDRLNDTVKEPAPGVWPQRSYNALPIDFFALAEQERDPKIKSLHRWMGAQEPSAKNAFTGLFKGYNLILITAESLSPYSIRQDLTPTLFKMANEGFKFAQFYNPIWGVSTSDGEYVACTGLLPKSGVWSFIESADKRMALTLGNQLRPLGYTTTAYHNHRFSYYKRHLSHPNMGYDYIGLGSGLDVTPCWPESDLEMIRLTVPQYVRKEPFHTYYMTVSGHMRYSFKGNAMAAKNRAAVDHLPLCDEAKAYLATQIELDKAMASLLEQLEAAGVADRTLIAMSADHYPFGLSEAALNELAGHRVERSFELYRSPFLLYTSGMPARVVGKPAARLIDTPCSSLDILPTLSNLLGLDFDARLLMGRDIFSDAEPLVIFLNKSFITSRGHYDALSGCFLPVVSRAPQPPALQTISTGAAQSEDSAFSTASEHVREMTQAIEEKFLVSARILDWDYYRHLPL